MRFSPKIRKLSSSLRDFRRELGEKKYEGETSFFTRPAKNPEESEEKNKVKLYFFPPALFYSANFFVEKISQLPKKNIFFFTRTSTST